MEQRGGGANTLTYDSSNAAPHAVISHLGRAGLLVLHEDVLWLDIQVADALGVPVFNTMGKPLHDDDLLGIRPRLRQVVSGSLPSSMLLHVDDRLVSVHMTPDDLDIVLRGTEGLTGSKLGLGPRHCFLSGQHLPLSVASGEFDFLHDKTVNRSHSKPGVKHWSGTGGW